LPCLPTVKETGSDCIRTNNSYFCRKFGAALKVKNINRKGRKGFSQSTQIDGTNVSAFCDFCVFFAYSAVKITFETAPVKAAKI